MQHFHRAITTILFAAHALLGCCAHHACAFNSAFHGTHDAIVAAHAGHDCADSHGRSHEPVENGEPPRDPCHHDSCSYVPVQPPRVDHDGGQVLWLAAVMPSPTGEAEYVSPTTCDSGFPVGSYSDDLYVRFCALLI